MKINWKARFKNKTFIISLATLVTSFVYQVFGMFEIVPSISESSIVGIATIIVNVIAMFGIVTDPTTPGVSDSNRAMTYFTEDDERIQ